MAVDIAGETEKVCTRVVYWGISCTFNSWDDAGRGRKVGEKRGQPLDLRPSKGLHDDRQDGRQDETNDRRPEHKRFAHEWHPSPVYPTWRSGLALVTGWSRRIVAPRSGAVQIVKPLAKRK